MSAGKGPWERETAADPPPRRGTRWREPARNVAIWAAIGAVPMLGFVYQPELRDAALRLRSGFLPDRAVAVAPNVLKLTEAADRHFYARAEANGTQVRFMIDTGASDIVLTLADARRIGIDIAALRFTRVYATANGPVRGAPVRLRTLALGPIELADVPASVNEGELGTSLLGMSFLRRMESVEFQGRELILRWR